MLPHKIVAFGTSSLAGIGDPKHSGFMGRLKKWHESKDFRNVFYNLGISGDTTTGMVKRFVSEASIRKPDLIIVTVGTNDSHRVGSRNAPPTTNPNEFQDNIKTLIKLGRSICDVVFVGVYPIDESRTAPLVYWKKDKYILLNDVIHYEKMVEEICKNKNVPYCAMFDEWLKHDYKNWLHEDGLHANAKGHEQIFKVIKSFLANDYLLKAK